MNYKTALEILNLGNNFYEDQVMQAYHIQMSRHDISAFSMASQAVKDRIAASATQIEAAKDFLLDYMAPKSYDELKSQIDELFNRLYHLSETSSKLPPEFESLKYSIISIALSYKSSIAASDTISFHLVDKTYRDSLAKIKNLYDKVKKDAYQEHNVYENDVAEDLNYEVTIEEFLQQITTFCEKYNVAIVLENKIQSIINRFKNEKTLDEVRFLIDPIITEIKTRIINRNYQDYGDILAILHQKISDIISSYKHFKTRIEHIKVFFEQTALHRHIKLETITNEEEYQSYLKTLNNSDATFLKMAHKITTVEEILKTSFDTGKMSALIQEIEEYVAREGIRIEVSKSSPIINSIFQQVLDKSYQVLKMCNIALDMDQINYVTSLQSRIMRLFPKVYAGEISVESLRGLLNLTFIDAEYDDEIIKNVVAQSLVASNIYLNTTKEAIDVFVLEIISGTHYLRKLDDAYNTEVMEETNEITLQADYISLAEFLKLAEFRGYNVTYYFDDVILLYGYKDIFMFLKDGKIAFDKKSKFQPSPNKGYVDIASYADKTYTKDMLISQINALLNENQERK